MTVTLLANKLVRLFEHNGDFIILSSGIGLEKHHVITARQRLNAVPM